MRNGCWLLAVASALALWSLAATSAFALADPLARPWPPSDARRNRAEQSWLWNTHYRGGRGNFGLTLAEFTQFRAVGQPRTAGFGSPIDPIQVDNAEVRDAHAAVHLQGVIYPGVMVWGEAGPTVVNHKYTRNSNFTRYGIGFNYAAGVSVAPPLGLGRFTPVAEISFRGWQADQADATGLDASVSGLFIRFDAKLFWEPFRDPETYTLDLYAGLGYHIYTASVDQADLQGNGNTDIDLLWGFVVILTERLALRFDARFPGQTTFRLGIEFLGD